MKQIENVGIKSEQKKRIIKLLKYGESINAFVQEAVEKKLKREESQWTPQNKK